MKKLFVIAAIKLFEYEDSPVKIHFFMCVQKKFDVV